MWLELLKGSGVGWFRCDPRKLGGNPSERISFGPDRFFTELITRSSTEAVAKPEEQTGASLGAEAL